EDVPELAEQIDRFVIGLAERIDAIQDAELARDTTLAADLAERLANDAERLGYPVMGQCARGVVAAARDAKPDALQEAVVELTDLAQRIRRGHRGAA
ncbi:MAG TPA: hypothetical protein PLW10_20755, partial [Myxococcota bacterium]|nr:hypothetical protein [Myxococcota bacterium]